MSDVVERRRLLMAGRLPVPTIGRVERIEDGAVPAWSVVDVSGHRVEPVASWLLELDLGDYSDRTLRAYSFALLTWLRVLWVLETPWDRAVESDVAAMVGWLRLASNPQRRRAVASVAAGSVNVKTGKRRLPEGYSSSKINQTLAAVHGFYGFHARFGAGPLVNPVPVSRDRRRVLAHHNPLQPFPQHRRAPLRQQAVTRTPRAIPDALWTDLFDAMGCDRDRAIASCLVSSGARSAELLGVALGEVDWPGQRLWVMGKGGRRRMVPVSPEAMRWLVRYVAEDPPEDLQAPVWRTRDGRQRPLTYWALRRVLQRANQRLRTDWTWHDLRHTAAIRMVGSDTLTLPEVQVILGHADLRTTGQYLLPRVEEMVDKLAEFYQRPRQQRRFAAGYAAEDVQAVFGG